jgi:uncharacterized protein (DUF1684 family)
MKKIVIIFFLGQLINTLSGQIVTEDSAIVREVKKYHKTLNEEYADPKTSPLDSVDLVKFKSLIFFPVNPDFHVMAKFKKEKGAKFKMKTSTDRLPIYRKYGEIVFSIKNQEYKLFVYQNIELSKKEEFKNYFFLPFTDLTTGETTYGGGRYIDLEIDPQQLKQNDNFITIDFNKAYNPYCAYAHRYSCPIPPPENFLNLKIEAGVKDGLIYK